MSDTTDDMECDADRLFCQDCDNHFDECECEWDEEKQIDLIYKEVEVSFYEIKGGKVKCISDSFLYELPVALAWAMNTAKTYPKANHIKIFLNKEHNEYLCFDKGKEGTWSHTSAEYEIYKENL